jgi:hypothetical protein
MIPKTRNELKTRILQDLGEPVIKVNVASEQLENAMDDALEFWSQYHHEGQDRSYLRVEITQEMMETNTIPLPESVFSVLSIVDARTRGGDESWMSYEFEMTRDALFDSMKATGGGGMSTFVMTKQYLTDIGDLLKNPIPFDFRVHKHELTIFGELKQYFGVGATILLEVMGYLWKSSYNVWGDEALRKLATAYTKRYWGQNLSKFSGVVLPGGQTMNGMAIMQDAQQEIEKQEGYILGLQEPLGIIIY